MDFGVHESGGRSDDLLFGSGLARGATPWNTSYFDPVLAEMLIAWHCPPGGLVLDPFCGGSVRGLVAGTLGRNYVGLDLRSEQIRANRSQLRRTRLVVRRPPIWKTADARLVDTVVDGRPDLVLTCPPYFNTERYSRRRDDLSNQPSYELFAVQLREVVLRSVAPLRANRFAVIVIGDVRGRDGNLLPILVDTIAAFAAAGARLHNVAVLVTPAGTLPLRSGRPFERSRKLGRTHQYVLVFVKGDPVTAAKACSPIELCDFEEKS